MEKKELYSEMFSGDDESRDKVIKELTPEENKLALEILEEKIDETPDEDTPSISDGPDTPNEDEDTPDDKKDKETKADDDEPPKEGDDTEKPDDKDFLLTEELIEKQPEENKEILLKYKDKGKDELAQAAAHAVALKSPYLKDNEKAISLMKEQFLEKSGDELITILIDTQKGAGKVEKEIKEQAPPPEIELPEIPENDPEMRKILDTETLKRLKAKYPNMPDVDSMDNEEYKEWRRDLDADEPDNKFLIDKDRTESVVKDELSKVVYIQKNLSNLYEDSPSEIIPLFTKENLPRLKALNDNPMNVLEQDITKEIEVIRAGLKKYGLTEKDLEIDLTITKDETGLPYNETLNKLIMEGMTSDGKPIPSGKIIGQRGKTFWLRQGELARKFREEFDDKILTTFVNKKTQTEKTHKEKLKDETLREAYSVGKGGKKVMTVEDVKKLSPEENKRLLEELERN